MPRLGHYTPGKESGTQLCRRMGGPQGWSGWVWNISPPLEFDPRTIQPTASHYTDYAIPVHRQHSIQTQVHDLN